MLFFALATHAQKISVEDARNKAAKFLSQPGRMKRVGAKGVRNTDLTLAESNSEKLYVFNVGEDEGFVVVSGDSRTRSILGYGMGQGFDLERVPDNMKAWLKGYEQAIAALDSQDIPEQMAAEPDEDPYGKPIDPLLRSRWDQSKPYNDSCPEAAGLRCLTGCVATALAQVLYYWKAPQHWVASQAGYFSNQKDYPFYVPELPAIKFRWEDMCDTYTQGDNRTDKQKSAVAELMRYCGQAMKMEYTPNFSGTPEVNMESALKEFGFSEQTRCIRRSQFSIHEWESMVYDHLQKGIPVPYTGSTDVSGHSFVCDGYGGNGMFHMNWGWGGVSDNYFLLSVLNPFNTVGSGASSSSMGFNIEQMMVVGAVPTDHPVGELPYLSPGYTFEMQKRDATNDVIEFAVQNASGRNGVFEMALATQGADGNPVPVVPCYTPEGISAASIPVVQQGYFVCSVSSAGLQDGTYDLFPVYRCVSVVGDTWKPVYRGKYIHAEISEGTASVTLMPALALCVEKVENKGSGYALETQRFVMTMRNDGEIEHTSHLMIEVKYEGDEQGKYKQLTMVGGFIPVGTSVPVEFFITPHLYGNATVNVYSGQNSSDPCATFPVTFNAPRKEFTEAIKPTKFKVAFNYDENTGLAIDMDLEVLNIFHEDLVRDVEVAVQNKETLMQQSLGRMGFRTNSQQVITRNICFSPSEIAASNFNTDLSDGLDFFVFNRLGLNNYPIFSIHIPKGQILTENGEVSKIQAADNEQQTAASYNLVGQKVNASYRGIVVKNGKKVLIK